MKLTLLRNYRQTHHGKDAWLDAWTLAANRGSEAILTWPLVIHLTNSLSYHGSYRGKFVAGIAPADFNSLRIPLNTTAVNPIQLQAIQAIVTLARQDHVACLFADPPMPGPVEKQPDVVALLAQSRRIAAGVSVPYYEGTDGFPLNDPALFHDSNHLSTAGRELYTTRFAEALTHSHQTSRAVHEKS